MSTRSTRQSSSKAKASQDFLLPEDIDNLSAFLEEQESYNSSGARPKLSKSKSSSSKKVKTPSPPSGQPDSSASVENLIHLEVLRKENLQTELKIEEVKLELAKLSTVSYSVTPPPASPVKLETVMSPSSTPVDAQRFATLDQLRAKKKTSTSLPNNYLFSAKGMVDYNKLDIAEFVSGFLEFRKQLPESSQPFLLSHLQLLMDRAITYSWSSVRNFQLSVHNAVEQGRLAWSSDGAIRERAQTFFTHQDLRSNIATVPSRPNGNSPLPRNRAKENYCEEWNYAGNCSCNLSDASYKLVHRCRVCDSSAHPMLNCAKRKYAIPTMPSTPPVPTTVAQTS